MSLVESLLDSLESVVREQGVREVRVVGLRVGALRQVVPEVLSFCFAAASEGTSLQGAELRVEILPVSRECLNCGALREGDREAGSCPVCGAEASQIRGGLELELDYIEVNEDEPTHLPEP